MQETIIEAPQQEVEQQVDQQAQSDTSTAQDTAQSGSQGESSPTAGPGGKIGVKDVQYEVIAHAMAYKDSFGDSETKLLGEWGFGKAYHCQGVRGLYFHVLVPRDDVKDLQSVVAFRGSDDAADWVANIYGEAAPSILDDKASIGSLQFFEDSNYAKIGEGFNLAGQADVTGHSLGGALAQLASIYFMGQTANVYTYQAPGVSEEHAEEYRRRANQREGEGQDSPHYHHHSESDDLVDLGGEEHLGHGTSNADFFVHNMSGSENDLRGAEALDAHLNYMLQTDDYAAIHQELGLDGGDMSAMGADTASQRFGSGQTGTVSHSNEYYRQGDRSVWGKLGHAGEVAGNAAYEGAKAGANWAGDRLEDAGRWISSWF